MRPHFILAVLVASLFSLNAQVSTVLRHPSDRSPEIEVQNNSAVNLTAFAVSMAAAPENNANTDPLVVFVDSAVDADRPSRLYQLGAGIPVPPNERCFVPVPNLLLRTGRIVDLFLPPVVSAAVFADGTTSGDPGLLARLISRRSSMLQAVELARDLLADAGSHNVPRGQLVQQFQTLADSVDHWYLAPEQKVGRALYLSIVAALMQWPQLPPGSAFPPSAFVDQQVASLNRQRIILLESQPGLAPLQASAGRH